MPADALGEGRSVKRNFSSSLIGQSAYAASQFFMLSILSHSTDPITVGFYALSLAIMAPIFILLEMRLRLIAATDARRRFSFGLLFGHRLTIVFVPVAGVALIGVVGRSLAIDFSILMAVTVYKAIESLLDITYGELARAERLDLTANSMLLRSMGNVAIFAMVVVPTHRVDLAYYLLAAYNVVCLGASLKNVQSLGNDIMPVWVRRQILGASALGLPLGLSFALGSMTVNMPRYFLQGNLGASSVAIFSASAYVLVAVTLLINSLAQASTPRLARYFASGDISLFRRLMTRTLLFAGGAGGLGVLGAWLFGKQFLLIAFGRDYISGAGPLLVLMIAATAQYYITFMRDAFVAMHYHKIVLPISVANLATVTVGSAWLVPAYGVTGAAFSVLGGQTLSLSLYALLFYKIGRPMLAAQAGVRS